MASIWEDYKAEFGKTNNALIQFILVNVSVFVITNILGTFFIDKHWTYTFIGLPGDINELLFKPWTLITYAFVHQHHSLFHLLGNMLGLYWFGRIIADLVGNSKLISLYFLGAIAGGVAYICLQLFSDSMPAYMLVGASGSVFAIAVAAATLVPDYKFNLILIGPVKISYIVGVYVFMSILGTKGANAGGEMAHLGGALLGFIYIKQLQQGNDLGGPVFKVIDFVVSIFKKKDNLKVSYSSGKKASKVTPSSNVSQTEIDKILDKISQSGYESLSKEEKQKLFSASQKK